MAKAQKEETNEKLFYDIKEVAELTGYSEETVRRVFAKDCDFPAQHWGKKYIVHKSALKQYCMQRHVQND